MGNDEWRLEVSFSSPPTASVLAEIEKAAGNSKAASHRGGVVRFYGADEDVARRLLAAAQQRNGVLVRLERWDAGRGEWLLIEGVERTSDADVAPTPFAWLTPRIAVVYVALWVVGGAFFYFVPGSAGSPNAGRHHDLGRAVALTLVVISVSLGYGYVRFGRRPR